MGRLALVCALIGACSDNVSSSRVCVPAAGDALRVLPGDFVDWWVAPNSLRQFTGQVSRADCSSLEGIAVTSDQSWLTAELYPDEEAALRRLVLTVNAAELEVRQAGVDGYDQAVVRVTADGSSAETRVRVRVIELVEVHVGYAHGTCRRTVNGVEVSDCDFVNTVHPEYSHLQDNALQLALEAHGNGGVRLLLHDRLGEPVLFDGVELGPDTTISAAPGVPASRVVIMRSHSNVLQLVGNRVHVERLTVGNRSDSYGFIAASSNSATDTATVGHVIENVTIYNYDAPMANESFWALPFVIGGDTVVRNNYIHGFFGGWMQLRDATGSRIVGNTIVYYGDVFDPWQAMGARGLTIANNVVVSLARPRPHWVEADGISELTVVGNAIEGYDRALGGGEAGDNLVAELELESPRAPLFLRDSEQWLIGPVAGEGTSMDGRDISGRLDLRPGAFQDSSEQSLPRHEIVRVGLRCGDHPCDISVGEEDALQMALWSSWPRGTVEVYPHPEPYSRGMISWGTSLIGMGESAWETMVNSERESWRLAILHPVVHTALLVPPGMLDPVRVSNLSLLTSEAGLVHHATMDRGSHDRHVFERLIVTRDRADGLEPAIAVGHNAVVRDVLIHGAFESCVTLGAQQNFDHHGPQSSAAWVLNVTCRLTGYQAEWPEAAFWVGGVKDALLANLVVDAPSETALFGATMDAEYDVHLPDQFTARACSYRGFTNELLHMTPDPARYDLENVEYVADGEPFLTEDGRLEDGARGIDGGVDPGEAGSLLGRFSLELGTAVDGTARAGRDVDQGAFEQGL